MDIQRRNLLRGAASAGLTATIAHAAPAQAPDLLPPGASHRFAQVNGIEMHYVVAGSGPPVVLLHGWPQTWFAWRDTMAALGDRFTLIAPDLRGIGRSQRTAHGYDKKTLATDIAALIAQATGGRAHVVGHDMGGKTAFVLSNLFPERVDRLVLVDCAVPGTESGDALHGGAWHYGFHMAPGFPEMLTAGRERAYIAAQIAAWSHVKGAVSAAAIDEHARHYATTGGMTAGFNFYRALKEDAALVATFATPLSMPVLTIGGRHSVGDALGKAMHGRAKNLTSVIAEDSGHFVAEEAPDFFRATLTRFLAA